jgi:divalent metal cation (Fe/Co/Zn/Cd) transporter
MLLEMAIITYNIGEGILSVIAGIAAGSIVLVGFGLDSAIEVSAALMVLWHLSRSGNEVQPEWERRVATFVGVTLLAVAAYVFVRAVFTLVTASEPEESFLGIGITALSVAVMPYVSRLQHRFAIELQSAALEADSRETLVCTYLSIATLLGLGANAAFGWWWADPVAALALVVLIAREGWEVYSKKELICVDD